MVVLLLEAIQRYGYRVESRANKRVESLACKAEAIGHHAPGITTTVEVDAYILQVATYEHLATREYDEYLVGIYVGCDIVVQYAEEILGGHIGQRRVHAAVATAVATL